MKRYPPFILLLVCISIEFVALRASAANTEIWVYTSVYKEFVTPLQTAFEAKNPGVKIQVFQAGSEKIQAKLEAEIVAQKTQADLLVISDPFYGAALEKRGVVEMTGHPANYNSLMVLIVNKGVNEATRPKGFSDLTKPEFKNQIQMGSPLESGTVFGSVAYLVDKYGWKFFEQLRKNNISATGGNSTVIQKVESGEKKIGIVLLENALAAKKKGSPIEIVYPEDGAIALPSVQLLLKTSPNKMLAKKFADFLVTSAAQKILVTGYMYSIDKTISAPEGAKSFAEATKKTKLFSLSDIQNTNASAKAIKEKFSEIVLE